MAALTASPWTKVSEKSSVLVVLLILCSCVTSTTLGYDGSMMNGLNILPSYTNYFDLNTTTLALNTSSTWLGSFLTGILYAKVPDLIGRKPAMFYAAILTIVAIVVQSAAQNIAMFVIGRILIGAGTGASAVSAPVYLAETLPVKWRGTGLSIIYDFWYVGGLIAAGITYGTAKMDSTWAWRLPSVLQGAFTLMCIFILPFIPESPRWLAYHGRHEEALEVLAKTYSDGRTDDPIVIVQHREILDALEFETSRGKPATTKILKDMVFRPSTRKRMILSTSVAVFTMVSGNNIISFYLGGMLENAGITDTTTQLEINIILNAFCLICSLIGTWLADKLGRKSIGLISTALLTVFIFLVGALTKLYGDSENTSGIYATVAMIFLFQGSYSVGLTPLTLLYPPEVMNYTIRSLGIGIYNAIGNALGLMVVWAFPFALDAIGWKTYMINGAWDALQFLFVLFYWVETKGKTLEEIDELLDDEYVNDLPTLEQVVHGAKVLDGIEVPLERQSITTKTKADGIDV